MDGAKQDVVSRDPDVVSGALVFARTRVPVKNLMDYLEGGSSLDEFLGVSREQAVAYLEMARKAVEGGVVAGSSR